MSLDARRLHSRRERFCNHVSFRTLGTCSRLVFDWFVRSRSLNLAGFVYVDRLTAVCDWMSSAVNDNLSCYEKFDRSFVSFWHWGTCLSLDFDWFARSRWLTLRASSMSLDPIGSIPAGNASVVLWVFDTGVRALAWTSIGSLAPAHSPCGLRLCRSIPSAPFPPGTVL